MSGQSARAAEEFARELAAAGWRVTRTGKNRIRALHPSGQGAVVFSTSADDWRALPNARSIARRIDADARARGWKP